MTLLILILPLLGFLSAILLSRYIGRTGSTFLTTTLMFLNVICTLILFYKVCILRKICFIKLGTWIYSDSFQVDWGFSFDNLTVSMLFVVNVVSALVHLYSTDYMAHDPHLPRFMSYLSLFTFFMLMLITGDNFVILFLGWEGVGICSYLLISFWYTRLQANKAAIKALVVNRVADFTLTIGMVAIYFVFQSLDFHVVFPLAPFFVNSTFVFCNYDLPVLTVICSLLFLGAMGKSAQIGLHTWLPDAMEGPTPVSALIHAATMVTAGVFLIIKCSPLYEYVPTVLSVITFVGATTAFFSATVGLVQNDIKKVIAYSTCSQLGYMIFACGLSSYHVSFFHLVNHAFFKALLFLSAGAIIHSLSNEQDMRKYGALASLLPFTSVMLLIGSLSLMGFPFLTGFYSKDLILELALTKYTFEGSFAYTLGLVTAFFTSYYSFRVFYMTFISKNNSFRTVMAHIHELPLKMAIALMVLSLGSIFFGYLAKDLFVGLGTDFWNHSIFILPQNNNQLDAEFFGLPNLSLLETEKYYNFTYPFRWIKILPFLSSLFAVYLVFQVFSREGLADKSDGFKFSFENLSEKFKMLIMKLWEKKVQSVQTNTDSTPVLSFDVFKNKENQFSKKRGFAKNEEWKWIGKEIYRFLSYKWYFDAIYNELINRPLLNIAYKTIFKSLDKGLLEIFGPYGTSYVLFLGASKMKRMQIGEVYYYAYLMITFLLLFIIFLNYFS